MPHPSKSAGSRNAIDIGISALDRAAISEGLVQRCTLFST